MTAVAPTWYTGHRGLALRVIFAGTGIRGMMCPPFLRALILHVGFRNAMRFYGCISALFVAVAGFALKWEPSFAARIRVETQGWKTDRLWWLKVPVLDWNVAKRKKCVA